MSAETAAAQVKLKYVATINDEALGEDTDPNYEIQYIDISNVDSAGRIGDLAAYRFDEAPSRARRRVRDGDVIISTVRTYLQAIAQIRNPPENLIASTGFAVVRPRCERFAANYCKYALREPWFLAEVEMRSVGVSYPAINASDLAGIPVHVHPLTRQRAIADYLDRETARIDALIAAKERLLGLLAEKRRAVITRAVTQGFDPAAPMRDSGIPWLGEIPAHWVPTRLKFLAAQPLAYGANESASEDDPSYPRFVRITDIDESGNLREESFRSLPPDIAAPYLLEDGDILFARSGATVGKAFIYKDSWGTSCFAGYLIQFRCNRHLAHPDFVYSYTQTEQYWGQIGEGTIQATIQNFSAEKYGDLALAVPPMEEQERIVAHIWHATRRLDALSSNTARTVALLKERRSALIAAAVTGQLDVGSAA